jgi:hypothetical protein
LLTAEPVNQKAMVHRFGEKWPKENAPALSAIRLVHSFSGGTPQNVGIPSGYRLIGE